MYTYVYISLCTDIFQENMKELTRCLIRLLGDQTHTVILFSLTLLLNLCLNEKLTSKVNFNFVRMISSELIFVQRIKLYVHFSSLQILCNLCLIWLSNQYFITWLMVSKIIWLLHYNLQIINVHFINLSVFRFSTVVTYFCIFSENCIWSKKCFYSHKSGLPNKYLLVIQITDFSSQYWN